MNDWELTWADDKYAVGRAMHEGWKRQKIANGFADHAFDETKVINNWEGYRCVCGKAKGLHHDDMIDWDLLPESQQAINYEGGREGYQMGFERGHEQGYEQGYDDGQDEGYDNGLGDGEKEADSRYDEGYNDGVADAEKDCLHVG